MDDNDRFLGRGWTRRSGLARALSAAALVSALAFSACSGGSDESDATTTTERSTTDVTPTTTDADRLVAFCTAISTSSLGNAPDLQKVSNDEETAAYQAELAKFFGDVIKTQALAPPELTADMAVIARTVEKLNTVVQSATSFDDLRQRMTEAAAKGGAEDVSAAGNNIGTYVSSHCTTTG